MHNFDSAFKIVSELVNDFKENERKYLAPAYQEAEVRRDFIDKFFEALGWDVYHKTQKNPYEQEVKVEKGVSVGAAQKRADYAFFIKPEFRQPKFFAEAKKPNRSLKNAQDYFQAVRYGWSAKTPVAVLTDFEELHILDCRIKPNIKNILQNLHHKEYRYTDFLDEEKFKEIYFLFSRDAVANDSLNKYSDALPKIKGKTFLKAEYQAIDDDFLEYIDGIRETLAKAFKKNDTALKSEELTEATQRTIDRLVFIRFLEDKLIEPEYIVSEFGKKQNPWKEFITTCRALDAKYNGIVFKKHFIDEQNFSGPEQNIFKKICDDISYLNSPYDFNAIPVHILGSIYERFLGKVVNATARQVKVEEKPEVRKAGGVYYTPKYIVDYIVENTVGKILYGESNPESNISDTDSLVTKPQLRNAKTPLEISKLRFADIACGSGSFLIGVFETLLKYHTEYYQSHPDEAKKNGCLNKDGQWVLSIKQKQNILLNNIYGVDIDQQAVEVTQLSLALKMLEDETTATANDMQVLFHEKILPDLSKNIVCGNSLIGTDIIYEENALGFSEKNRKISVEEERKLNPMDFETVFPHIFPNSKKSTDFVIPAKAKENDSHFVIPAKAGIQNTKHNEENYGFDAIVGNPPWVDIKGLPNIQVKYYFSSFESSENRINLYAIFIEKCLKLLKNGGVLGYITPNSLLFQSSYSKLRKLILDKFNITKIIRLPDNVFRNVKAETIVSIINRNIKIEDTNCIIYKRDDNINEINTGNANKVQNISNNIWLKNNFYVFDIFSDNSILKVLDKIEIRKTELQNICDFCLGLTPYDKYKGHSQKQIKDRVFHSTTKIDDNYKELLEGGDVSRYFVQWGKKEYIKYGNWLGAPREKRFFTNERILVRQIVSGNPLRIYATYTIDELYNVQSIFNILLKNERKESMKYILGILNSSLMNFYHSHKYLDLSKNLFQKILIQNCKKFPFLEIDFQNPSEKRSHDLIVSLVDQMLSAKKQLHESKTDKDKTYYERRCTDLDRQIDTEVYKLYGLTDEEIKIVEGKE